MRGKKPKTTFSAHEIQRFILPITTAFLCIITALLLEQMLTKGSVDTGLILYGTSAMIYAVLNNILLVRTHDYQDSYGLLNAIFAGIWLGSFTYIAPADVQETAHILILLGIIAVAIVSGRFYSYLTLVLALLVSSLLAMSGIENMQDFLEWSTPYIIGIVAIETVIRIKDTTRQEVHRLETINNISRQIMLSLDVDQTIAILNATMQEALEADTYILGTIKENEIFLPLFYDEGQYFHDVRIPLDGTLSGWVVRNERELFLPDLRKNVQLDGVSHYIVGKEKTSLSWMGVPLNASNVKGLIALGSYQPNAFDSGDLELLSNLVQHVSLALDNAYRHAQVEEQARLDSLTSVFNHGYFLKDCLNRHSKQTKRSPR